MPFRPQALPKKLPIDLALIDSDKGSWLIAIDSTVETQGGRDLHFGAILEQSIGEPRLRSRKLSVTVNCHDAHDPDKCSHLLDKIRVWIETTEGDGALDLTIFRD
jgi:hypothetical protein